MTFKPSTAIAATAILLSACSDVLPSGPETPAPTFRATVETLFKGWFPLTPPPGGVFNACTGEPVLLSGEFNLIVRRVTSSSGQTLFLVHSQVNLAGVGAVSGTTYQANEVLNLTQMAGPTSATVFHLEFHTHTVSAGSSDNSSGVIRIQVTVNADGTVTVDKQTVVFDVCKG
jgi:hypothetical protein